VVESYNVESEPAHNDLVVNFPAAGSYPFELDYSNCCDGTLTLTVFANGAPIPPAAARTGATISTAQAHPSVPTALPLPRARARATTPRAICRLSV